MAITPHTDPQTQHTSGGLPSRAIHLPPSVLRLAEMNAAIGTGEVSSPLFRQDIMYYRDRWWELTRDLRWVEVTHAPAIASYDAAAANITPEVGHGLRAPPTSALQCAPPSPGARRHASNHHQADASPTADAPTTQGDNVDTDEAALDGTARQATRSDDTHRTCSTHQAARHH